MLFSSIKHHSSTIFVTILLAALLLRLPLLSGSFWLDEAAQALESARPLSQQLDIIPDFQPPLLHLILHFAMLISHTEWWLRLIGALIPGLLTIAGTYLIGKRLFNAQVGLWATLLLATSSLHIFFSQELRQYSLPAMWAVLSWLPLLPLMTSKITNKLAKQNSARLNKTHLKNSHLIAYALITAAGLYTSYLYPFFVIGQATVIAWVFRQNLTKLPKALLSYCLALTAGITLFLPWLPTFLLQLAEGGVVREQLPGWAEVVSTPQLKALPLVAGKFLFGVVSLDPTPLFLLPVLLIAALVIFLLLKRNSLRNLPELPEFSLIIWLVVPLLTAWIISFWVPVVQPKRVLFLLPAFYLLLSVWIANGWQHTKTRLAAGGLLGLILTINLLSTWAYFSNPQYQREDWRSLQAQIETQFSPENTILVFSFPGPFAPWVWYDQNTFPTLSTGTLFIDDVPDLSGKLRPVTEYDYILVFDYLRDLTDPSHEIDIVLQSFDYRGADVIDYPNIGFVRVYTRSERLLGGNHSPSQPPSIQSPNQRLLINTVGNL
jgi:mannosyltransferase